jgi:hypothetical protein
MNRRRLEFGGSINEDCDAIQSKDAGAGGSSAQVQTSAVGESPNATGATCATGLVTVHPMLLEYGFKTPQREFRGSHEAGTSAAGNSGRIFLTPQATGTSANGRSRWGMLTPLEHEMADGVHTLEEEQRFTHVSFC